jgi:hypothetical protein
MFQPATLLPFAARRSSLGLTVENYDGAAAGLAPAPPYPNVRFAHNSLKLVRLALERVAFMLP